MIFQNRIVLEGILEHKFSHLFFQRWFNYVEKFFELILMVQGPLDVL